MMTLIKLVEKLIENWKIVESWKTILLNFICLIKLFIEVMKHVKLNKWKYLFNVFIHFNLIFLIKTYFVAFIIWVLN